MRLVVDGGTAVAGSGEVAAAVGASLGSDPSRFCEADPV